MDGMDAVAGTRENHASGYYNSDDLKLFTTVVDDALAAIYAHGGADLTSGGTRLVRIWLSTAVFSQASEGERDPLVLKQAALDAVTRAITEVETYGEPAELRQA